MSYRYFRFSVILAFFLQALGGWLRYFAGNSYGYSMIGTILLAISQTFTYQMPAGKFDFQKININISSNKYEMVSSK